MGISNIPTTRLSNAYIQQRILGQILSDQESLFQIQTQVSSGRRIAEPSEDSPAALRAMALQSLIERKNAVRGNLAINQDFLSTSESAIGSVSTLLSDVRAAALSVAGTAVSQLERDAAMVQVNSAIDQLLSTANRTFRGQYLFAGSKTLIQPYQKAAGGVAYFGNDASLSAFSDVDTLFAANVTGAQAFGGLSDASTTSADLNPVLTFDTKLNDLRGGRGIRTGSIVVSDGANTSTISIAGASTIGDVARLLEAHPPGNRTVTARVTARGLEVSLDSGNLSIDEVGGGSTAAELGIRRVNALGPGPIVGEDLDPRLTPLTDVKDILGSRARAYLGATGGSNDLIVEAVDSGTQLNGVTIKYVDDNWFQASPGITAGNEFAVLHTSAVAATTVLKFPGHAGLDNGIQLTATTPGAAMNGVAVSLNVRAVDGLGPQFTYNSVTKAYGISVETGTTVNQLVTAIQSSGGQFTASLTAYGNGAYVLTPGDTSGTAGNTYLTGSDANTLAVHVASGSSTANQVIAAVTAQGAFTARLDPSEEKSNGFGTIVDSFTDAAAVAVTSGGSGENLDLTHGLLVENAGRTFAIDFSKAGTVEDLLNAINGAGANLVASVNATGTGIDVRSRLSGASFSIGENGGTTATQLGIRTTTTSTALSQLNEGRGVRAASDGDDFSMTRRDGTTFNVRLKVGVPASARISSVGLNSGLLISRTQPGTDGNQFKVRVIDSGAGGGDAVTLVGDTLQFNVDVAAGFTAQEAVDLLAADATLGAQFVAQLDRSADATNDGSGNLTQTAVVSLSGGRNAAQTVGDVLDLINNHPTNLASGPPVIARLAAYGNGIELINDGPPASSPITITRVGASAAAIDLGLVPSTSVTSVAPTSGVKASATFTFAGANNDLVVSAVSSGTILNGATVHFADDGIAGNNFVAYDANTRTLTINVDPATTTAQDVVDLLANDPLFRAAPAGLDGGAANNGTGVLGSLPADGQLAGGTTDVLAGIDPNKQRVEGVFSALLQLRDAIQSASSDDIGRAIEYLDTSTTNLTFARSTLGATLQGLDVIQTRLEDDDFSLQGALSTEIDVDFAAAISQLNQRQSAFQASLKIGAQLTNMTLLDFL